MKKIVYIPRTRLNPTLNRALETLGSEYTSHNQKHITEQLLVAASTWIVMAGTNLTEDEDEKYLYEIVEMLNYDSISITADELWNVAMSFKEVYTILFGDGPWINYDIQIWLFDATTISFVYTENQK